MFSKTSPNNRLQKFLVHVATPMTSGFEFALPKPSNVIQEINDDDQLKIDIAASELKNATAALDIASTDNERIHAQSRINKASQTLQQYNHLRREWELRISLYPTHDNLLKAARALTKVFSQPGFNDIVFKCLSLKQEDTEKDISWDGTIPVLSATSDRDQRGKEICIFMQYNHLTKQYQRTPAQWKHIILTLWKALLNEGVEHLGYSLPPCSEQSIEAQDELLSPFMYSSYKISEKKHGALFETTFNPMKTDDPLKGVVISKNDLKEYKIPYAHVRDMEHVRLSYAIQHVKDTKKHIDQKIKLLLTKLQSASSANSFESNLKTVEESLNNAEKLNWDAKNVLDERMQEIISAVPRENDSNLNSELVKQLCNQKNRALLGKPVNTVLVKSVIIELKKQMSSQKATRIIGIIQDFKDHPEALAEQKLEEKTIAALVTAYPADMQLLFRSSIHHHRETLALHEFQRSLLRPEDPGYLNLVNLILDKQYWDTSSGSASQLLVLQKMRKLISENARLDTKYTVCVNVFEELKKLSLAFTTESSWFSLFALPHSPSKIDRLRQVFHETATLDELTPSPHFQSLLTDWQNFHSPTLQRNSKSL